MDKGDDNNNKAFITVNLGEEKIEDVLQKKFTEDLACLNPLSYFSDQVLNVSKKVLIWQKITFSERRRGFLHYVSKRSTIGTFTSLM